MGIIKALFKIAILALIVYAIYIWLIIPYFFKAQAKVVHLEDPDSYIVMVDNELSKVQLIGVDAPENKDECFGEESKKLASRFFSKNREITLESDSEAGEKDVHGRDLMYMTLQDGTLLNEQLIKDGLAKVYVSNDTNYKHKDAFLNAEEEAKSEDLGMWSEDACGLEKSI
jgi:micrococcal nuclease